MTSGRGVQRTPSRSMCWRVAAEELDCALTPCGTFTWNVRVARLTVRERRTRQIIGRPKARRRFVAD